jgi:DNA-directed RNA polymerase subunit M/transcription elongation factor TFIIS
MSDSLKRRIALDYQTFYASKNYNNIRRSNVILIIKIMIENTLISRLTDDEILDVSRRIEEGCLKDCVRYAKIHNIWCSWKNDVFINMYNAKMYKVLTNIDVESSGYSPSLIANILDRKVNPEKLGSFSYKDLCPEDYEKITQKEIKMNEESGKKISYSRQYKCKNCKQYKCRTQKRFNRSFDEGVNLTITCDNCGFTWNG